MTGIANQRNLEAALDRLIPAVDTLPAAGAMGLLPEIERMAAGNAQFVDCLQWFGTALAGDVEFSERDGAGQEQAISAIESADPAAFGRLLELVYLAYYSQPDVHARIGWRSGPLQPLGFELPPFDASRLETTRQRPPFWRKA
jgi:hypothetical protein